MHAIREKGIPRTESHRAQPAGSNVTSAARSRLDPLKPKDLIAGWSASIMKSIAAI
jgi:hypothetical protein